MCTHTCMLRMQGVHATVAGLAYDHSNSVMVLAGLGGPSKTCPGLTLSAWTLQGTQLKMVWQQGSPKVGATS